LKPVSPYLKIFAPATPAEGITVLDDAGQNAAVARWNRYLADGGTVCKFVPASGAASRMFKALFAFVDGEAEHPAEGSDVAALIKDIHRVAFFNELDAACIRIYGKGVDALWPKDARKM